MENNHTHGHNHCHDSVKNIKLAFFLNLFFTIIEFIGGILTNSVAIMSDALHDLGDSFSLGFAWFLEKYSNKKRNNKFSYGFKRFSLLGAFINATILLIGSLFILTEAIPRIIHPEPSNAYGMILLSIFGILVNGFAVYKTTNGKSMNEKVISLHLLEDVLGWIAVLVISIVMIFTDLIILDPILSMLITLYILWGVIKNLKQTVLLFLQASPENLDVNTIDNTLKKQDYIKEIHDTHIWSLDGESNIMTTHIVINEKSSIKEIKNIKIKTREILEKIGIKHSTIEIDFGDEKCKNHCD
ncbi:MAG: cation diffusion facilitator family transporter [Candidatus Gracilibacteria bacterium]|nr:cation diffusion facilitator family transporter [Candidatus Gracilibacteria bacterium]